MFIKEEFVNKKIIVIVLIIIFIIAGLLIVLKKNKSSGLPPSCRASVSALLALAKESESKDNLLEARNAYQKLVNEFSGSAEVANWQKKSEEINIKLLFSPTITPKSALYEIKPGDTLNKIAKSFKSTPELIMKSNHLSGDKIIPGRKIKIWTEPFSVFVDKSQNTLMLKSDDEIIKTYIISTGTNNSTPVGTFKIVNKLPNPTWFKAGAVVPPESPQNVLGTRWLGFDLAGYGIHGTVEPQNLGKQVTQGCVRMANPEVEELYTIIPVGTEVTIVD